MKKILLTALDNYFALLSNGKKEIILKVSMDGDVSFFKERKAASA